ncbi:MAG TPA: ATP-grasp domain-containing protein [Nitrospirota bacterium]|nr:ATP-grasp domain-containing protein [Nitrospirota bacterium]
MKNSIVGTTALITDVDRRKSLPIIQALGRAGVRVIGISYKPLPVGWFSKYCRKVYRVPDYRTQRDLFLEEFERVCRSEKPDVLYPLEDEMIVTCSKERSSWEPYTSALIPDGSVLDQAYDKWETIKVAKRIGIPVPDTYCPENAEEARAIAAGWRGEAVIKPRKSSGSRGLVYVNDGSAMLACYQKVSAKYERPLIQERIPAEGSGLGVFALISRERKVVAVFGHKRLRQYPVSGGPSTLCVSYRDNDLIRHSMDLFKELGLTGVVMAEYKIDVRKSIPVLMEINARFWGSLQLAIYAGVNFPVLYHKAAMGLPCDPVLEYPVGKYWRWLIPGDILHFLSNPNRIKLEPSFFNLNRKNCSYDISMDDPFPAAGMLITAIMKVLTADR